MLEGYKVVRYEYKRYYSVISSKRVEYFKDMKNYRPEYCGPLALFDTFLNAQIFTIENLATVISRIYKCQYELSNDKKLWYMHRYSFAYPYQKISSSYIPEGTIFANWIKLIEPVSHTSY